MRWSANEFDFGTLGFISYNHAPHMFLTSWFSLGDL